MSVCVRVRVRFNSLYFDVVVDVIIVVVASVGHSLIPFPFIRAFYILNE